MTGAAALTLAASPGWIAHVSRTATGGLVTAAWQGILLSFLVALVLRLLPKTPAAIRFAIWFGVFVVVVVAALPLTGLLHRDVGTSMSGHAAWLVLDQRWCLIVAAVWGIASLVRAVTLLLAVLRVHSLWKRATPLAIGSANVVPSTQCENAATSHSPALWFFRGLREQTVARRAELCASNEVDRPAVIGFFSPRILIPTWLVGKLTAAELEQVVLHEAGHLSRADDWMNLLQKIALVVFPLNPALAWVERRLCFERELACDERVLQTTSAPKAYAACLATLAEHRLGSRGLALALGALGRESELGRRVGRILRREQLMRPLQARLVLGGAMLGLLTAAAGLERCPQIVGFAPATQTAAGASEPLTVDGVARNGYGYQSVVFHPANPSIRRLRTKTNAAYETKLIHRSVKTPSRPTPADNVLLRASVLWPAAVYGLPRSVEPVRSHDVSASTSNLALRNTHQSTRARSVVEWVVVTSWRGDDGSRLVLTTVRSVQASASTQAAASGLSASEAAISFNQVHPYATVPVRDGWLVIQL
jgi:hypothetical protein